MEPIKKSETVSPVPGNVSAEFMKVPTHEKFIPKGAIAFFISLVILCLIIWFGIYFLMLERS